MALQYSKIQEISGFLDQSENNYISFIIPIIYKLVYSPWKVGCRTVDWAEVSVRLVLDLELQKGASGASTARVKIFQLG